MIFTDTKDVFVSALFKNKKEGKKTVGSGWGLQREHSSYLSMFFCFFFIFWLCFQNIPLLRFTWKMMEFFLHFCLPLYSTAERWITGQYIEGKRLVNSTQFLFPFLPAMSEDKPPDGFSVIFNYLVCCFRRPANSDPSPQIFHAIWQPVRQKNKFPLPCFSFDFPFFFPFGE